MHAMAANNPIVAPTSTTAGLVTKLIAQATHKQAHPQRVQVPFCNNTGDVRGETGKSATNSNAHAALKDVLRSMGLTTLPCDGTDPGGQWPTEHGLLVPGIGKATLRGLATVFGQNAVLWIEADGVPRLELLR